MFRRNQRRIQNIFILIALLEDEGKKRKVEKRKKIWIHEINIVRELEGEFHTLYPLMRKDEERFHKYFRMSTKSFDIILDFIKDDISKVYTNYRKPIEPEERLAVTLRYLATGDSFGTIGYSYRMGFTTVSLIVNEVCDAIWKKLQPIYMSDPTKETWEKSIAGFQEKWQFPNCLGAIDGKHVTIKCPARSGSNYYCYLHKFSMVLMAIVDFDYKFICVDVGNYGKNSDGGIFENSNMGIRFNNQLMNVPQNRPLPGQTESSPCVLVGDQAFALSFFLMRPFPEKQAINDNRKEIFNKRLCRARRVVENAFGILVHKWKVFQRPIELKLSSIIKVVKAACILHNFTRIQKQDEIFVDSELNQGDLINLSSDGRRSTNYSFQIRERFVEYFNNSYV